MTVGCHSRSGKGSRIDTKLSSLSTKSRALLVAASACCAAIAFAPATAGATDLSTDSGDPNGAPPPPPPMPTPGTVGSPTPPPPAGSTAATLQESSDQDTGVGLHFVYIQPEVGYGVTNLGSGATGNVDLGTPGGPVFGLGAGAELITFQLGGRLRMMPTKYFNLWTVGGEVAYQPGSGRFWPRIGLAAGYAWVNGFDRQLCGNFCDLVDVSGLDLGVRAGFQYFVTPTIELGLDGGLDALLLKRKGINGNPIPDWRDDGSSTGFLAVAMAHVGLHWP